MLRAERQTRPEPLFLGYFHPLEPVLTPLKTELKPEFDLCMSLFASDLLLGE